jgi:hypothetical protein
MRYGDEIGMGDDLALEERYAVRTPMQWAGSAGGGFSAADPQTFVAPMIDRGPFRYQKVNVADSLLHRHSLLHRIIDIANTRSEFPEIAVAPFRIISTDRQAILGSATMTTSAASSPFLISVINRCVLPRKGSTRRCGRPAWPTKPTRTRSPR